MNLQEQSEQERIIQNTKELNERIDHLEEMLHDALHYTYVGETYDLYARDGELHITYQDGGRELIMCTESLFKDLPFIINQVCKEQKKMNKMYLKQIKKALK
tara:strand:+ start:414 stop:719 length:306 start_codon:yes stop_codon:yes gene_type:complete